MTILYPFLTDELGALVLWISMLAGLASALVNGVTDKDVWGKAGRDGASGVFAAIIHTFLIILRSMVLGVFAGTVLAGFLIGREQFPDAVIAGAAGIAAFVADPVLTWLKDNIGDIVKKVTKGKLIEGNSLPDDHRSASAGNLDN